MLVQGSLPPWLRAVSDSTRTKLSESLRKSLLLRAPKNDEELWLLLAYRLGIAIARRPLCPEHSTPFQWLADAFFHRADRLLAMAAKGSGKSLAADANILTPSGWRCMGDLQIGDAVIGGDGTPTVVLGVYPQGRLPLYQVTFSDGTSVDCSADHLWLTQDVRQRANQRRAARRPAPRCRFQREKYNRGWQPRTTAAIAATLYRGTGSGRTVNHAIPMVGPVKLDSQAIRLDPYLLGVLLGDGGLSRPDTVRVSTADAWLVEELTRRLPLPMELHRVEGCDYLIAGRPRGRGHRSNPVLNVLREYGLSGCRSHEKFVPWPYLWNDIEVRLAVLQGLLDTDGTVDLRGHVSFCTVSDRLAEDVEFLVRSLGGVTRRRRKQDSWDLTVSLPTELAPFRLPRKAARVRPKTWYPPRRYVRAVEPSREAEAICIAVAHATGLYVTDAFIVTHNTKGFALLHELNSEFKPGTHTSHVGSIEKQARRCWDELEQQLKDQELIGRQVDPLVWEVATDGVPLRSDIRWRNGSRVEILAGTLGQVSGVHPNIGAMDEFELVNWEVFEHFSKALHETQASRAQMVIGSTRFRQGGPVERVIEQMGPALTVRRWCIYDTMARCEYDCHNFPGFGQCPLWSRIEVKADGSQDEVPMCHGRAHEGTGHLTADEVINAYLMSDQLSWGTIMELRRPQSRGAFYPECEDDVHYRTDVEYVPGQPVYLGYDDGFHYPSCLGAWQLRSDGFLYQFDEIYATERLVPQLCEELGDKPWLPDCERGWPDPSAYRAIQEFNQFFQARLGRPVMVWDTDNNRIQGWRAVRRRLRGPLGHATIAWKRGACLHTWQDVKGLTRKEGTEDCEKKDDHGADQSRYLVHNLDQYLGRRAAWTGAGRPEGGVQDQLEQARLGRAEGLIQDRWDQLRRLGVRDSELQVIEKRYGPERVEFARALGGLIAEQTIGGRLRRAGLVDEPYRDPELEPEPEEDEV